jgi:DNA-binding response OmpR family regulator
VVLVDDDQSYLEVIAAELGDCGFSVHGVSDGKTFLEA